MRNRRIGHVKVSAIGLSAAGLSGLARRDAAITTIHAALDAGITLIDAGGEAGGDTRQHHTEELIAEALRGRDERVLVATAGPHANPRAGARPGGFPAALRAAAQGSAARLGVDAVGLFHLRQPGHEVPWEEAVGALSDLLDEGVISLAGITDAAAWQIEAANRLLGGRLASVQHRFSPFEREREPELDLCAEHDIAFLALSPLGGGTRAARLGSEHPVFADVAAELRVSVHRVALAWELAMQHTMIPLPGVRRAGTIRDCALAADVVLTAGQIARLDA